jgi:hypothetical protein
MPTGFAAVAFLAISGFPSETMTPIKHYPKSAAKTGGRTRI